jgi:hypothetical protein
MSLNLNNITTPVPPNGESGGIDNLLTNNTSRCMTLAC